MRDTVPDHENDDGYDSGTESITGFDLSETWGDRRFAVNNTVNQKVPQFLGMAQLHISFTQRRNRASPFRLAPLFILKSV